MVDKSTYFATLHQLLDAGQAEAKEGRDALLAALDNELARHDFVSNWLANHYSGAAEYLLDFILSEGVRPDNFNQIKYEAEKEIKIFNRNGYIGQADRMAEWLNEALANG